MGLALRRKTKTTPRRLPFAQPSSREFAVGTHTSRATTQLLRQTSPGWLFFVKRCAGTGFVPDVDPLTQQPNGFRARDYADATLADDRLRTNRAR